jgi:hypothetical protein
MGQVACPGDPPPQAAVQASRQLLLYMPHRLLDFREAEIVAVSEMHGLSSDCLNLQLLPGDSVFSPLRLVHVPDERTACSVVRRAVLSKGAFEVWGTGRTLPELKASLRQCAAKVKEPWCRPELSFKWIVDGFGKKILQPQQLELMRELASECPFQVRTRYAVRTDQPRESLQLTFIWASDCEAVPCCRVAECSAHICICFKCRKQCLSLNSWSIVSGQSVKLCCHHSSGTQRIISSRLLRDQSIYHNLTSSCG